jgi:hypothetical protein
MQVELRFLEVDGRACAKQLRRPFAGTLLERDDHDKPAHDETVSASGRQSRSPSLISVALGWSQDLAEGRAPVVRAALERAKLPVLLVPVVTLEHETAERVPLLVSVPSTSSEKTPFEARGHTIERMLD